MKYCVGFYRYSCFFQGDAIHARVVPSGLHPLIEHK
jgi:hypothetical protein